MISKSELKALIRLQKVAARKSIAATNVKVSKIKSHEQYSMFRIIADERKFLSSDFSGINDVHDLMSIIHDIRHKSISRDATFLKCRFCRRVLAEMAIELPGGPAQNEATHDEKEDQLKPRFGNLIAVLEEEVQNEVANMERRQVPSQNDLTRWALKEAVLRWYKNQGMQDNTIVVDDIYDDRLITELAPDFSQIYEMWLEKLDELKRLDNRYTLNPDEFDKAHGDLVNGMRGSAFEKQLDRYREDFMQKLYAKI